MPIHISLSQRRHSCDATNNVWYSRYLFNLKKVILITFTFKNANSPVKYNVYLHKKMIIVGKKLGNSIRYVKYFI